MNYMLNCDVSSLQERDGIQPGTKIRDKKTCDAEMICEANENLLEKV
jgi:hypothetical protein